MATERLAAAGAEVDWIDVPEFDEAIALIGRYGTQVAAEGYAQWRDAIEAEPDKVYHNVLNRFRLGAKVSAVDLEALRRGLADAARRLHARMAGAAALLAPTVPIAPPPIAPLVADDELYLATNLRALGNTTLGNLLATCALTLPCGDDGGGLPVGLMLMGRPFTENALLRVGAACEAALADVPRPTPKR